MNQSSAIKETNSISNSKFASTPPLGWNSFDSYGVYLHEKAALENLEVFAEKLKPSGFEYFVIDSGWFGEFKLFEDTIYPKEKHAADVRLNENGLFLPSKTYFPNGLEPIIKRCHQLDLKFGIHLMRGIPRKAVHEKLLIEGTNISADKIAITEESMNCKWCDYCYCVDHTKEGAQEWYNSLIGHLSRMGVDLIKYDDIVPYPDEIELVVNGIKNSGRELLLSLSPGGKVNPEHVSTFQKSNMLRVTPDIWDDQEGIDQCFTSWKKWQNCSVPGFWIDMDMIPFGQLQLMCPQELNTSDEAHALFSGRGFNRNSQFTKEQMLTFITMRGLSASPLMVGGDLPTMDEFSYSLITNKEILECNQNGVMGTLLSEKNEVEIWKAPRNNDLTSGWLGIFNRSNKDIFYKLNLSDMDIDENSKMEDIWNPKSLKIDHEYTIQANSVLYIKYYK